MGERNVLPGLAVLAFLAAALSYLPAARLLHYATIAFFARPAAWLLCLAVGLPVVLLHEKLVRGLLYGALRARVRPGFGAPLAALAGVALPMAVRLYLFRFPAVPWPLVAGQAFLVELPLSLALCLLALATGGTRASSSALFLLWAARVLVVPTFRGSPLPTLEILAAILAAVVVPLVLHRPLAPHREALEGLS